MPADEGERGIEQDRIRNLKERGDKREFPKQKPWSSYCLLLEVMSHHSLDSKGGDDYQGHEHPGAILEAACHSEILGKVPAETERRTTWRPGSGEDGRPRPSGTPDQDKTCGLYFMGSRRAICEEGQ